ncbi:hypothetical protein HZC21_03925 [Candidatus Peregrinibacteria bacterium]|nr:hypothetical protein [Candidatus Peregrinibacteria bacterium]
MGKHKKVLYEAVSEMKHFLMGAALVLTLTAIVPVLAQTPGPRGDASGGLPLSGRDAGLRSTDSRGQQGEAMRQGQQGEAMRQGQQGEAMRQGQRQTPGQRGGSVLPLSDSEAGRGVSGERGKVGGEGKDMKRSFPGQGRGVEEGFPGRSSSDLNGKASRESTPQQIQIQPIRFDDLEDDTFSTAVSAVAENIVNPALAAIESGTITKSKRKSFINKVSKALNASAKKVCATFEDEDNKKECSDIYKSFKNDSRKVKSVEELANVLGVFMDNLDTLAEISASVADEALEEESLEE